MKALLIFTLVTFGQLCLADEGAVKMAKTHLSSNLKGDYEKLAETYASEVMLMPGHEFLKEEYGLAEADGYTKGAKIDSSKLIETIAEVSAAQQARPAERIDEMLKSLKYESVEIEKGDFAIEPSDPVETKDGKLHFSVMDGDVLLKVSPPKGDFLLLHLRKKDGAWKVVSEYLD